jgi:uncharacterized protein YraI
MGVRPSFKALIAVCTLALAAGPAVARDATTTTALAMRAAPSGNTELLLTIPAGSKVKVGGCDARGWCRVTWASYSGYASRSGLSISAAPRREANGGGGYAGEGELVPIFPPYPYRAGHYPKADWYYKLPPYAAIDPSFYRRRFFMMAQERNRYRYMPFIFHGYSDGDRIEDVDIQGISSTLRDTYGE